MVLALLLSVLNGVCIGSSVEGFVEEYILASPTKHETNRMQRHNKAMATVLYYEEEYSKREDEKDCFSVCPTEQNVKRKVKRKTVERNKARDCKQQRNEFA